MKPLLKALIITVGAVASSVGSAQAQLLAYENFGITAGSGNIGGSSGDLSTGFSTNWTTINDATGGNIISPGYTYSGLTTSGNRAQIFNAAATPDPNASYLYRSLSTPFSVAANSTGTMWASFLIQATTASTGGLGATVGFFSVAAPAANTTTGVTIGAVGGSTNYRVANRAMDTSGSGAVLTTTTAANTFALAVVKLTIDTNAGANETVSFWLNPNLSLFDGTESSLGTAALSNQSLGNMGISSINSVAFGSNYVNTGSAVLGLDEVRMGTTLVSVVPEPTTWALLAGSMTMLMVLRRRSVL